MQKALAVSLFVLDVLIWPTLLVTTGVEGYKTTICDGRFAVCQNLANDARYTLNRVRTTDACHWNRKSLQQEHLFPVISQRCTVVQNTVVWAVRLSIGNTWISTPCKTKTRQPIKTKFGRSDHAGEYIRSAKKFGGVHWVVAPARDGRLSNFCDFVLTLFFPNQPTGQMLLLPTMYYASNDVVSLIHVLFGGKSC